MSAQSLMCSRGFLAPVVLTLLRSVQVAAKVLNPPKSGELTPSVGYPIAFDGLETNVRPDYSASKSQSVVAEVDQGAGYVFRALRYDIHDSAGLGDRLSVIARLLSIATAWNVRLAFPPPQDVLGKRHGNSSALWWDEYVVTEPRFVDSTQHQCAPGATTFNITSKEEFESLAASKHPDLVRADRHVCISLQEHYFTLMQSEVFKGLTQRGALGVSLWTSWKVATMARGVRHELAAHFNAMHVRLGDKSTPKCSSPAHVTGAVINFTHNHPVYAKEPWFLMSDGGDEFFTGMRAAMREANFQFITERDLVTTRGIDDNFLVFSALECVFAGSDLALISFKDIGSRCMPDREHAVQPKYLDCREHHA